MAQPIYTMSDYDFVTVGAYICYLEQSLGLAQINPSEVYSFSVQSTTAEKLLAKKQRLEKSISENNSKLSVYVGEASITIENGLDIIRSMYRTNGLLLTVIEDHVQALRRMLKNPSVPWFSISDDEIPF